MDLSDVNRWKVSIQRGTALIFSIFVLQNLE